MNDSEKDKLREDEKFRFEELHKVSLSSFVQSSYELDKTILNLSVGSLGFILTFATTYKYSNSIFDYFSILSFIVALCGFGFVIYRLLNIFNLNKEYFKKIISNDKEEEIIALENSMSKIDKVIRIVFIVSILFSSLFILLIIISKNL